MKFGRLAILTLSFSVSVGTAASAASVTGSAALALAGVVAPYSYLPAADKRAVAKFFEGHTIVSYAKKISVTADKIVCRTSNVDITARSCELTFKNGKHTLRAREANELYATEALAGAPLGRGRRIDLRKPLQAELHARSQGHQGQGRRRSRVHVRAGGLGIFRYDGFILRDARKCALLRMRS